LNENDVLTNDFIKLFQGKHKAAKEAYEQLIECEGIPSMLKANALRQHG
jgi:hypothetical protein